MIAAMYTSTSGVFVRWESQGSLAADALLAAADLIQTLIAIQIRFPL